MNRLITLLLFALIFSQSKASELPKLNLQIGKKYLIETIYLEDTSKTNNKKLYDKKQFEFEATDFNKAEGTYKIKLVLKYYLHVIQEQKPNKEWVEKEVYETGTKTNHRRPIVYLNMCQIPVRFSLSTDHVATSFDFSDFSKYKSPEGYPLSIGELDEKDIAAEISALFFDPKKTQTQWNHRMDIRSDFRISGEDKSFLQVQVTKNQERPEKGKPTNKYTDYRRNILVDKATGLIKEDNLNFNWNSNGTRNITRYQKLISPFADKFEVKQKTGVTRYEKTEIQNPNTSIRITMNDSVRYAGNIYISYWDEEWYRLRSFQLEKDTHGAFNFQFRISKPQMIYIQHNNQTMELSDAHGILLYPGDGLEVEIRKPGDDSQDIFRGIGADESRILQSMRQINRTYTMEKGARYNKSRLDRVCLLLNAQRGNLNPDFAFERLNTQLYINGMNLFRHEPDSTPAFDFLVYNTLAKENTFYYHFLRDYTIFAFVKNNRFSSNIIFGNDYYSYARFLFPEPILTNYLTDLTRRTIESYDWEEAKTLFQRFKQDYADYPGLKAIEQLYEQQSIFAPGQPFPLENLSDFNGNKVDLRAITKNKLVVVRVKDLTDGMVGMDRRWESEYEFAEFKNDLVSVRLLVGTKQQLAGAKDSLKSNPNEILLFKDVEELYWETPQQIPLLGKSNLFLGRDGKIVFNQSPSDEELRTAIVDLKKPQPIFGKSAKIFIFSLSFLVLLGGLAFLIYRRITIRRFRQEALKRKMRELELTVIRTQMNPHFMYNCLNSIQNLVQKNRNEEAHLYISKFASLVRQALNNSKRDEISLITELDSIKQYIELEQLRFEFRFSLLIEEGFDLNNIFIPPMLLQPFVENAILHGLITKNGDRLLEIRIGKNQNHVELIVEDNGIGREAAAKTEGNGHGQGILLSKNRLDLLAGKTGIHYELKIEDLYDANQIPCGTRVSIEFEEEE